MQLDSPDRFDSTRMIEEREACIEEAMTDFAP
jgi:hypothetical protein